MIEITQGEVSMNPLQKKELEILKEIIKVLDANGVRYCAVGGTCLGAVRHKGFIPWDDDIDIALPRKEYERFRTELYKQLPPYLQKLDCDCKESPSYDEVFMKIHDPSTTFLENRVVDYDLFDRATGVFVDIFPVDGRPDNSLMRKIWFYRLLFLSASNTRRRYPSQKIKGFRGLVKEVYGGLLKKICRYNYFSDALRRLLSKYDIRETRTAIWHNAKRSDAKKYYYDMEMESDFFLDTIPFPFEDITVQVPRKYHAYLTLQYGDYMQPPPESERGKWHNVIFHDLETPCAYYAKQLSEGKTDVVERRVNEKEEE